jgi:hypothetical protein
MVDLLYVAGTERVKRKENKGIMHNSKMSLYSLL